MKITIEFDPIELAKRAQTVTTEREPSAPTTSPEMASPDVTLATAAVGAIDAGPGPGPSASEIPAELATQATAIGAISAGSAPNLV
jgi:hypothetical protein